MGEKQPIHIIQNPNAQNWVLGENHPTQGRRFLHATEVLAELAGEQIVQISESQARAATVAELSLVHTPDYISRILDHHICGEWDHKRRPDLAQLAAEFAGGTMVAAEALLDGALLAVNYPGAKHHAQRDHSSGFCVFADFAMTAKYLADTHGKRIAILDVDAHHGDGTENLTRDDNRILTFSIHEGQLFPFSATEYEASPSVHNRPFAAGAGDDELVVAVQDFVDVAKVFQPDIILIAAGGDGHSYDPLSNLEYSEAGFAHCGELIRANFPETPVLLGGAGGYRPDDHTPSMWLHMTLALAGYSENEITELKLNERVERVRAAHEAN